MDLYKDYTNKNSEMSPGYSVCSSAPVPKSPFLSPLISQLSSLLPTMQVQQQPDAQSTPSPVFPLHNVECQSRYLKDFITYYNLIAPILNVPVTPSTTAPVSDSKLTTETSTATPSPSFSVASIFEEKTKPTPCKSINPEIEKSEPGTSSSSSNSKMADEEFLRNIIRTAGAIVRPGKPTCYFQLRQRRDSAEITSLAKDMEARQKRHVCSYPGCNKAYFKRSHLREHSYVHTGDKPYFCSVPECGARFTRADQLSRHRRAHTGERNFCCLVCGKRFKRSDHLKVHLARHALQKRF
ncbi:hypothetical protein Ciccas_010924 [Cichlidogyrus casuarinus]|uniref:C2H2-type domain-containing protein n=1 Tax=Cichlidogyrus casuarinus TaxID=1844966 RepID=A0ABD2PUR6_9PLAT